MPTIVPNEEYCIGCRLCEIACMVEHSGCSDVFKALRPGRPRPCPGTVVEVEGDRALSISCRHCDHPPCVLACLTGAMHRSPEGRVVVDRKRCAGCWTCVLVCPFGAVAKGPDRKVASKCDFCPGRDRPACVEACPNRALRVVEGTA